jgi:hypothetical protein
MPTGCQLIWLGSIEAGPRSLHLQQLTNDWTCSVLHEPIHAPVLVRSTRWAEANSNISADVYAARPFLKRSDLRPGLE